MRISHKSHLIYFSIPKTGSESVREFLDPISEEKIVHFTEISESTPFYSHMRPCEVKNVFFKKGWNFDVYMRVATVRNPWARLASLYKMMCRNWGDRWQGTFAEWVYGLDPTGRSTNHMPEKWYAHGLMSMTNFLSDKNGELMVDRIFRIEDQTTDFHTLLITRAGAPLNEQRLMHTNQAEQSYEWQTMYSKETQAHVAELYADDIARFGYTFG